MSQNLPPSSQYPKKYDTDRTLLQVYNTTESVLIVAAEQFDTTLYIRPVAANDPEIWADNGYATISGEVLYYENVSKDQYTGKVNALLNCLRNIGGKKSKFNPAGTDIRGFVMAEHHNQLTRAIVNTENFIGYTETPDQNTLDWRIRNLANIKSITDDSNCPEVTFNYIILEKSPVTGTKISYAITITGTVTNFILDFGDGTIETNSLSGTHSYPANFIVDPVLTVNNETCSEVLSGVERETPRQRELNNLIQIPTTGVTVPLIPDVPTFPNLPIVPPSVVPFQFTLPPIVIPRFGDFPSTITLGGNVSIPSIISVGPIPSVIIVDTVPSVIAVTNIPSVISLTPINANFNFNDCFSISTGQINIRSLCTANPYPAPFSTAGTSCNGNPTINNLKISIEQFKSTKPNGKIGDVRILLVGPSGTGVLLFALGPNNYTASNYITLTFDDSSGSYILPTATPTALSGGTYHPSANGYETVNFSAPAPAGPYGTSLSSFYNEAPSGSYSLYVQKFDSDAGYSVCQQVGVIGTASLNVCVADNICFNPPGPTPAGPTPAGPSPAGPSPAGPSPAGPSPAGPSPAGPSPAGPSPAGPSPAGPSPAGPSPAGPSPAGPTPAGPPPPPFQADCTNCTCEFTYSPEDVWDITDFCRDRSGPAQTSCIDNCDCPSPPTTPGNVGDVQYLSCLASCSGNCQWNWDGSVWVQFTFCENADCSCPQPATPGTSPTSTDTTNCTAPNSSCSETLCLYSWDAQTSQWVQDIGCIDTANCYCEEPSPGAPNDLEETRVTSCLPNGNGNACAEIGDNKRCECPCIWDSDLQQWFANGECMNKLGPAEACNCCGDCDTACSQKDPPLDTELNQQGGYAPCIALPEPCVACKGQCQYRCNVSNEWFLFDNTCAGSGCSCPDASAEPCNYQTADQYYEACIIPATPVATPVATPISPIAGLCEACSCQRNCVGGVWVEVSGCVAVSNPISVCADCVCPDIGAPCNDPSGYPQTAVCNQAPPPGLNFDAQNFVEDSELSFYAVKDPIITNNVCRCIQANADEASFYFENLGIFDTKENCNKFVAKQNAHLLDNRNNLKELEVSIGLYKQQQVQNLSNYINKNMAKEINTYVTEEGELKITKTTRSLPKTAKSSPLSIPEIQFMPEIAPTSQTIEVVEENKEIKMFEKSFVSEDIKIEKIDISEKEEDVRKVENIAVDLINVFKANTLFKNIDEKEKESTQFKDRS